MNSLCLCRFQKNLLFSYLNPLRQIYVSAKYVQSPSIAPKTPFLKASLPVHTQFQTFWETFPVSNFSYHAKDGLSQENNTIVYRAKIFNYVFYAQLVSMVTVVFQVVYSAKYLYKYLVLNEVVDFTLGPFTMNFNWISLIVIGIFTYQNMLLFYMAQRAVLRVYHRTKSDDYVFVSLGWNPFQSRLTLCKPGELKYLKKMNLLEMWGNYTLHDRKYFLNIDYFKGAVHINKLLGATSR